MFRQFIADTDVEGVGVVLLDTWSTDGNGVVRFINERIEWTDTPGRLANL